MKEAIVLVGKGIIHLWCQSLADVGPRVEITDSPITTPKEGQALIRAIVAGSNLKFVYGADGSVGSFAVQLARQSQVHPIICVAGQSQAHVETLIDRNNGDTVIDYRLGHEHVVQGIKNALNDTPRLHAFDAVADDESDKALWAVVEPNDSRLASMLPKNEAKIPTPGAPFPEGVVLCCRLWRECRKVSRPFGRPWVVFTGLIRTSVTSCLDTSPWAWKEADLSLTPARWYLAVSMAPKMG